MTFTSYSDPLIMSVYQVFNFLCKILESLQKFATMPFSDQNGVTTCSYCELMKNNLSRHSKYRTVGTKILYRFPNGFCRGFRMKRINTLLKSMQHQYNELRKVSFCEKDFPSDYFFQMYKKSEQDILSRLEDVGDNLDELLVEYHDQQLCEDFTAR